MRFSSVARLASAGLASIVAAEDLLFYSTMADTQEYIQATTVLGLTAHVATPEEWASYTTADFEKYKAIVIPDPMCGTVDTIDFFDSTKATWGPAVQGNIILIGTDPTFHSSSQPGALTLINNALGFSASGNGTGLYFALSCYYGSVDSAAVDSLSYFGTITVRGNLACYNDAHLVADSTALGTLDDAALSDWSCSVHEVFSSYPTTGQYGFVPLAIAQDAIGDGQKDFADGSTGIPYIIVKGATPDGCGDGVWDPTLEEECDAGPLNGTPASSCSSSCKCLNGAVVPGVCRPPGSNSTSSSSLPTPSSTSLPALTNSSSVVPSSTFSPISANSSIGHQLTIHGDRLVLGAYFALRFIHELERSTGIVIDADCARPEQLITCSFEQHEAIRAVLFLRAEQLDQRAAYRNSSVNTSKPEHRGEHRFQPDSSLGRLFVRGKLRFGPSDDIDTTCAAALQFVCWGVCSVHKFQFHRNSQPTIVNALAEYG
ncbi:hypothetical protein INS49_013813 [Diaporthe citri]|uniref:uncharacterized protein n=1 Tax=Diaporthe citri TaxID=83186 RepID=UPI001C822BDF|nr:uncharacterized protein INS49_013813 [Diaporthe citri]KAG6357930.1 hypothetical protein INS49_013813 [Diaporthe citri]